jgi:dTDP-4-dehydrorhamnose 3,5-epimerase-like enzyme
MPHEIVTPTFERIDDRGTFTEILNSGSWEGLLAGRMNPDSVMGNHYHKETLVFFYLTRGSARIKTIHVETGEKDDFVIGGSQGVILKVNESHSIRFMEESDFVMLKSRRFDPSAPDTFHFPVEV